MDDLVKRLWKGIADLETQQEAADRIEALEAALAKADDLEGYVEGIIEDGCPKCGGDCSAANPPVGYCPMKEATSDLATYRTAREATK